MADTALIERPDSVHAEEAFGIECRHHYGITTHDFVLGETPEQTVYRIMREKWHAPRGDDGGLRDDNHTWEVSRAEHPDWFSRVRIIKNEKSPRFVIKPWWLGDGPGTHWFDQEFRIATRGTIEREIADRLKWAAHWREVALREKPTKIGAKRAFKAWDRIPTCEREAASVAVRWPQFSGVPRSGWQARLHEGPNHG